MARLLGGILGLEDIPRPYGNYNYQGRSEAVARLGHAVVVNVHETAVMEDVTTLARPRVDNKKTIYDDDNEQQENENGMMFSDDSEELEGLEERFEEIQQKEEDSILLQTVEDEYNFAALDSNDAKICSCFVAHGIVTSHKIMNEIPLTVTKRRETMAVKTILKHPERISDDLRKGNVPNKLFTWSTIQILGHLVNPMSGLLQRLIDCEETGGGVKKTVGNVETIQPLTDPR